MKVGDVTSTVSTGTLAKVSTAAMFGSMTEVFDWVVGGPVSVIVWPLIFFPKVAPATAVFFGLAAYVVSFIARPAGAVLFGHIGDRTGRRTTLVWTLLMMGGGTLILILVPGYNSIGIAAVVILVLSRILIGLGFGGEYGSATTWVIEHAANRKTRGFWVSMVSQGMALGGALAGGSITIILTTVGFTAFVDFWWRVPFMISLVVVALGAIIRYKLAESPIFKEIYSKKRIKKRPSLEVFRKMPRTVLMVIAASLLAQTPFYIGTTVMIDYIERTLHKASSLATGTVLYGELFAVLLIIIIGITIFRVGRRRMLIIWATLQAILTVPFAYLVSTGVDLNIIIAQTFFLGLTVSSTAILASFLPENFPSDYRTSGTGLTYQIGVVVGSLPESFLLLYLLKYGVVSIWYMVPMVVVIMAISITSAYFLKESKDVDLVMESDDTISAVGGK